MLANRNLSGYFLQGLVYNFIIFKTFFFLNFLSLSRLNRVNDYLHVSIFLSYYHSAFLQIFLRRDVSQANDFIASMY